MKIPKKPPNLNEIEKSLSPERIPLLRASGKDEETYRHWDTLRHLTPPEGLAHEEWWLATKWYRMPGREFIPLEDAANTPFSYILPPSLSAQLHQIDLNIHGPQIPHHSQGQYLVHSLIKEAITSSQIEGAATTMEVAENMLKSGRPPRNLSEQMIVNNYLTMQEISHWKEIPLSKSLLLEMHKVVTENTLPKGAGRFRLPHENVTVIDATSGETLHTHPPAEQLEKRLEALFAFANGQTPHHFIHPLIRAILIHFWLAYEHPFIDGNGRTARSLFYWSLLRSGYTLFRYVSISPLILQAPSQYIKAFLYTETDDNDLTYFILHQMDIINRAVNSFSSYLHHQTQAIHHLEYLIQSKRFNPRQEALLAHALHHPNTTYTIQSHKTSHNIAYDTARKDLFALHHQGLLQMEKRGKAFIFKPPPNLSSLLKSLS